MHIHLKPQVVIRELVLPEILFCLLISQIDRSIIEVISSNIISLLYRVSKNALVQNTTVCKEQINQLKFNIDKCQIITVNKRRPCMNF